MKLDSEQVKHDSPDSDLQAANPLRVTVVRRQRETFSLISCYAKAGAMGVLGELEKDISDWAYPNIPCSVRS